LDIKLVLSVHHTCMQEQYYCRYISYASVIDLLFLTGYEGLLGLLFGNLCLGSVDY